MREYLLSLKNYGDELYELDIKDEDRKSISDVQNKLQESIEKLDQSLRKNTDSKDNLEEPLDSLDPSTDLQSCVSVMNASNELCLRILS